MAEYLTKILCDNGSDGGWFQMIIPIIFVAVYILAGLAKMRNSRGGDLEDQSEDEDEKPRSRRRYKSLDEDADSDASQRHRYKSLDERTIKYESDQQHTRHLPYAQQQKQQTQEQQSARQRETVREQKLRVLEQRQRQWERKKRETAQQVSDKMEQARGHQRQPLRGTSQRQGQTPPRRQVSADRKQTLEQRKKQLEQMQKLKRLKEKRSQTGAAGNALPEVKPEKKVITSPFYADLYRGLKNRTEIRKAFIYSEILSKPLSLREGGMR